MLESYQLTVLLMLAIILCLVFVIAMHANHILLSIGGVQPDEPIKILTTDKANGIDLTAVLCRYDKVCFQMDVSGDNIKVVPDSSDYTLLTAGQRLVVKTVLAIESKPFKYSYKFRFWPLPTKGSPDLSFLYSLPFQKNSSTIVSQGFGQGTHLNESQYAVDFAMDEGTPICAARDGTVAGYCAHNRIGGDNIHFRPFSNFILIRHNDGTYAWYGHLKHDGVLVNLLDNVSEGQLIALSGNTGFSLAPHLHFAIYVISDNGDWTTIPMMFNTDQGSYSNPVTGDKLSHPDVEC